MEDWIFEINYIKHKCGQRVIRPVGLKKQRLHCSKCNIPIPYELEEVAEWIYEEYESFGSWNFYFRPLYVSPVTS